MLRIGKGSQFAWHFPNANAIQHLETRTFQVILELRKLNA